MRFWMNLMKYLQNYATVPNNLAETSLIKLKTVTCCSQTSRKSVKQCYQTSLQNQQMGSKYKSVLQRPQHLEFSQPRLAFLVQMQPKWRSIDLYPNRLWGRGRRLARFLAQEHKIKHLISNKMMIWIFKSTFRLMRRALEWNQPWNVGQTRPRWKNVSVKQGLQPSLFPGLSTSEEELPSL